MWVLNKNCPTLGLFTTGVWICFKLRCAGAQLVTSRLDMLSCFQQWGSAAGERHSSHRHISVWNGWSWFWYVSECLKRGRELETSSYDLYLSSLVLYLWFLLLRLKFSPLFSGDNQNRRSVLGINLPLDLTWFLNLILISIFKIKLIFKSYLNLFLFFFVFLYPWKSFHISWTQKNICVLLFKL